MRDQFIRRTGAALVVASLVISACGDDDAGDVADPTSTDVAPTTDGSHAGEATTTAADTTTSTSPDRTVIDVSVADGEVTGGGRHEVDLGDTVTIRVTSDAADHVHLHGYDVLTDVGAGETAELTFEADIPGVFEVELEDSRIPLLELEIS